MGFNSILSNFKKFQFSDDKVLNKIITNLTPVYNESDKKNSLENTGNLKSRYKSNFSCNCPWIDSEMWNIFKKGSRISYPEKIRSDRVCFTKGSTIERIRTKQRREFNREVAESTKQCVSSYTTGTRRLCSSERDLLGLAGIKAAQELKIRTDSGTNTLIGNSGRIQSVTETAKNTNSGYPFYNRKNSTRCVKDTISWMNYIFCNPKLFSLMKNPLMELPISIFYRTQPSIKEEENEVLIKIREVWGLPQRLIALEYYFFKNILKNVYENNKYSDSCIYSSGLTNYEISVRIIQKLRKGIDYSNRANSLFSMDYSKFDRTVPSFAIDLFYSICAEELNFCDKKEEKLFYLLRFYIKHSPFCFKNKLYFRRRGIPSGSYITNLIDTWWNLTLWIYSDMISEYYIDNISYLHENEDLLNKDAIKLISKRNYTFNKLIGVCGDDTAIITNSLHIYFIKLICEDFGMSLKENVVCTDSNSDIYFLGRYWGRDNSPFQSDLYMLSHIVIRTKFYKKEDLNFDISENLTVMRILSILLQFSNGLMFLRKYLSDYNKINEYLSSSTGFYLLKEYPVTGEYNYINKIDAQSWQRM